MFFFIPHKPSLTPQKPSGRKQDLQRAVSIHRSGRGDFAEGPWGWKLNVQLSQGVVKMWKTYETHMENGFEWKTDVKMMCKLM